MKKIIPVMSLMLVFAFGSCEKENVDLNENESQNLEIVVTSKSDTETFERRMQWLSFITAKALANDVSHLSTFNNAMTLNNTISANTLFGGGSFSGFEDDFRELVLATLCSCGPDPDHDPIKPDPPIIGNGFAGFGEKFASETDEDPWGDATPADYQAVDDFINYIIVDNCVELYFPNGSLNLVADYKFTSTAHPLTSATSNDGIKRFIAPFGGGCVGGCTDDTTVNDGYVFRNNNVIVARPKVTYTCGYGEYSEIDFTDFLD